MVLANGPACNRTPVILRKTTAETHVCYFPADGGSAAQYDNSEKRLRHVDSHFGNECKRIDVLTETKFFSKPRPTTPLHRVGFNCLG